jgi:NADH-quinone oxidoreductase subunit M
MLWTLQRIFLGKLNEKWNTLKDLEAREYLMFAPLTAIIIFLGVNPSAMLNMMTTSVNTLVNLVNNGFSKVVF